MPLYGDGQQRARLAARDDHCRGIDVLIEHGTNGEVYNIGGGNEVKNVDLTHRILDLAGRTESLIKRGGRSPGARPPLQARHDQAAVGWDGRRSETSPRAWPATVAWYRENEWWWRPIKEQDPAFREFYQSQYGARLS